jgi:hypothetical protein
MILFIKIAGLLFTILLYVMYIGIPLINRDWFGEKSELILETSMFLVIILAIFISGCAFHNMGEGMPQW